MRTVIAIALLAVSGSVANAHIHLTSPQARTDSLTGDQKAQHCGVAGQTRNPARVTTFRPGQTITVTWMETINHPGWFRIAFQPDGATFGIPPVSNGPCYGPENPMACNLDNDPPNFPTENQEGIDALNGSIVLADRIPDGTLSAEITLPNMECNNCTLQFIQVMTDKYPYTIDENSNDIYFNCADITLSNDAPTPPDAGVPTMPDAGDNPNNPGGGETTGGCSTGGAAGLPFALVLLGLLRRRRR